MKDYSNSHSYPTVCPSATFLMSLKTVDFISYLSIPFAKYEGKNAISFLFAFYLYVFTFVFFLFECLFIYLLVICNSFICIWNVLACFILDVPNIISQPLASPCCLCVLVAQSYSTLWEPMDYI